MAVSKEFPRYMQKGSSGPHVAVLQIFLFGAGWGKKGLVPNWTYDEVTAEAVRTLQRVCGLDPDGNFGPMTRATVQKSYGFNFEQACRVIPGGTTFVQPEGPPLIWNSGPLLPRD